MTPSNNDTTDNICVACYVRASSLVAPLDATLRRLERLEADGVIDEVVVNAWPREVRLSEESPYTDAVSRFEAFATWADTWNVSIQPPFSVETRHSAITGDTREVLIMPVQCLAAYVDGALAEVFPHTACPEDGGETYTVQDALALLEAHASQAFGGTRPAHQLPSQYAAQALRTADPR